MTILTATVIKNPETKFVPKMAKSRDVMTVELPGGEQKAVWHNAGVLTTRYTIGSEAYVSLGAKGGLDIHFDNPTVMTNVKRASDNGNGNGNGNVPTNSNGNGLKRVERAHGAYGAIVTQQADLLAMCVEAMTNRLGNLPPDLIQKYATTLYIQVSKTDLPF